ncbi:MAG: heavy-metal-associated domain-containing protein [Gemmatimonadetes bacterium]|nr:heavy-metal-associated domain-containing protein [Gemmatimonadota bacterium]
MKRLLLSGVVLLAFAVPSQAQIRDLTVRVDGLTCPFCAYGLEKRLSRIDEVADVSVDQPKGLAVVTVKPGRVPDFHQMRQAILDSGFTPRAFNVTATGRIETWNGRLTLVVPENERFLLTDEARLLGAVVGTPQPVTVTGVAAPSPEEGDRHHQHPFTIAVARVDGVQ